MKNLFIFIFIFFFISCASFNEGELHYYNSVSYGQQMLDLQEALKNNAINQLEFEKLKKRIMENDIHIPDFNSEK